MAKSEVFISNTHSHIKYNYNKEKEFNSCWAESKYYLSPSLSLVSSRYKVILFINRKSLDSCSSFLFALNNHISVGRTKVCLRNSFCRDERCASFVPSASLSPIFEICYAIFFHFSLFGNYFEYFLKTCNEVFCTSRKKITDKTLCNWHRFKDVDCHQKFAGGNRSQRRDH